jgi:hypothetical protein
VGNSHTEQEVKYQSHHQQPQLALTHLMSTQHSQLVIFPAKAKEEESQDLTRKPIS